MTGRKESLIGAEDEAWGTLRATLDPIPPDEACEPGFSERWSVKDLMAHIAGWQAEAARALSRMREGTYEGQRDEDTDAVNERIDKACRELSFHDVRAQLFGSRQRMLEELDALPELTDAAEEWFVESGAKHYEEHLPRLREWIGDRRLG